MNCSFNFIASFAALLILGGTVLVWISVLRIFAVGLDDFTFEAGSIMVLMGFVLILIAGSPRRTHGFVVPTHPEHPGPDPIGASNG